jgi:hypothetical protein
MYKIYGRNLGYCWCNIAQEQVKGFSPSGIPREDAE